MSNPHNHGGSSGWLPRQADGSYLYYDYLSDHLLDTFGRAYKRPSDWNREDLVRLVVSNHDSGQPSRYLPQSSPREAASEPRNLPTPNSIVSPSLLQSVSVHGSYSTAHQTPISPSYEVLSHQQWTSAVTSGHNSAFRQPQTAGQPREHGRAVLSQLAGLTVRNVTVNPVIPTGDLRANAPVAGRSEERYLNGIAPLTEDSASVVPDDSGLLYKDFKSHKRSSRKFFKLGKVFRALWSQPGDSDSAMSGVTAVTGKAWTRNSYGEWMYSKVRMFVVVREGSVDCQAVPITSYAGKGVAKTNVKKSDHAIIYTGTDAPKPMQQEQPAHRERGLQAFPIRVDVDQKGTKLDIMSRVDLGRPCTIHNYMRVKSFGKVNRNSMHNLLTQYRTVQADSSYTAITEGAQQRQSLRYPVVANSSSVTLPALRQRTIEAVRDWMSSGADLEDVLQYIRAEMTTTNNMAQPRPSSIAESMGSEGGESAADSGDVSNDEGDAT